MRRESLSLESAVRLLLIPLLRFETLREPMADQPPKPPSNDGPQPIPPEKRRRLQQCFEHGSKSAVRWQLRLCHRDVHACACREIRAT